MSKFYWVILYLAIGGVVIAPSAIRLKRDCGSGVSITEFSVMTAVWPALLGGVVAISFMDTDGLSECKK